MSEIQIVAGKWRRRDGSIVDVVEKPQYDEQGMYPWINASDLLSYTSRGCVVGDGYPHNFDLIECLEEQTQPEPGNGWRLLKKDEPLVVGDQWYFHTLDQWVDSGDAVNGSSRDECSTLIYRRRLTQPEPAKAELVPGWYWLEHSDKSKRMVYFVGRGIEDRFVMQNPSGMAYTIACSSEERLTPYTPPSEPRTWMVDVIHVTDKTGHEIDLIRQVGQRIFPPWKELGRETVTIKEKVKPCPTK